jgi:ABC-type amino acid transport substrate-binding protein
MRKLKRKYWFLIGAACLALALFLHFIPKGGVERDRLLVVGLQSGYPPFEFRDIEGQIVGFDVDVAQEIADKIEKKLVLKDMDFDGLILSLKQGKIDLILSGMNITPSRLKEIAMIPYHGERATHLSLIFWGKVPEGVQKIEDISKLPQGSISVESGSIPDMYMSHYPQIRVKTFQGALEPLMDVKYGKSTANLVEPDVAKYLKGKHPEVVIIQVPLLPDEQVAGFGIGMKKSNTELYERLSSIVEEMKKSGRLKELEERWFKEGGK